MFVQKLLKHTMALALTVSFIAGSGIGTFAATPSTTRILMIGNSLTSRECGDNYTIPYLEELAECGDHKISITKVTKGGEKLYHFADSSNKYGKKAQRAIDKGNWDIVLLQDETDTAIRGKSASAIKILTKKIKKTSPNAKIYYDATWAYNKTVKIDGKKYTYNAQRKAINKNYEKAAKVSGGTVIYSGNAFYAYKNTKGSKNLYLSDKNHPNKYGAMLHASCLYAKFFGEDPRESFYTAGLGKSTVNKLKKIAYQQNQ